MNRLYAVETMPTTTGMKAEHRLALRASEIAGVCGGAGLGAGAAGVQAPSYAWTAEQQKFLAALAKDLKANAGKCAVIPGCIRMSRWHRSRLAINAALGQCGQDGGCLVRAGDSAAERSDGRSQVTGRRFECGQGPVARDSECESDLLRAC